MAKGILEGLCCDLVSGDAQLGSIDLFCGGVLQSADSVLSGIRFRHHELLCIFVWMYVDIFLIGFYFSVQVLKDEKGTGIFIDSSVAGNRSRIACTACKVISQTAEIIGQCCDGADICAGGTNIKTRRFSAFAAYRPHCVFKSSDIFDRHDRSLLKYIGHHLNVFLHGDDGKACVKKLFVNVCLADSTYGCNTGKALCDFPCCLLKHFLLRNGKKQRRRLCNVF